MKISTTTGAIDQQLGYENAIRLIQEAGFDYFDLSLSGRFPEAQQLLQADTYRDNAHHLRQFADSLGFGCNQTHAPFPTSWGDQRDAQIFDTITRAIEFSAIMGAKIIVIHPKQHLNYADNQRSLFAMNVEFYKKLVPYAEEFGITIATENMWQRNNGSRIPSDSVCSRSWEFCELIDAVDSPRLAGCLDIGHASLMGADIPQFIRDMGPDRLLALHIHDTDLVHDSHTLPFTQSIDYLSVAQALGEIGYRGDFTFESDCFFQKFPRELLLPAAKLMMETGRYLAGQAALAKA